MWFDRRSFWNLERHLLHPLEALSPVKVFLGGYEISLPSLQAAHHARLDAAGSSAQFVSGVLERSSGRRVTIRLHSG